MKNAIEQVTITQVKNKVKDLLNPRNSSIIALVHYFHSTLIF